MKIDVMVGVDYDDLQQGKVYPVVAGALDHTVLEVIPVEDEDALWRDMKAKFTMEPDSYVWRQITVDLAEDELRKHFAGPDLVATITAPEEG